MSGPRWFQSSCDLRGLSACPGEASVPPGSDSIGRPSLCSVSNIGITTCNFPWASRLGLTCAGISLAISSQPGGTSLISRESKLKIMQGVAGDEQLIKNKCYQYYMQKKKPFLFPDHSIVAMTFSISILLWYTVLLVSQLWFCGKKNFTSFVFILQEIQTHFHFCQFAIHCISEFIYVAL